MAWRLNPGNDLVLMLHLRPTGQPESVEASVGLYFSDVPPTRVPAMVRLNRQDHDIPAGESQYIARDSLTLPVDVSRMPTISRARSRRSPRGQMARRSGCSISGTGTSIGRTPIATGSRCSCRRARN
jgi:hypothetical protein